MFCIGTVRYKLFAFVVMQFFVEIRDEISVEIFCLLQKKSLASLNAKNTVSNF